MSEIVTSCEDKALEINLEPRFYGTFAEIGAGQEVARHLFRIGGAAGTIAKSISAYDMKFSDAIYGPSDRYVSRARAQTMLDFEFSLLQERLSEERRENTCFFTFADTVAARSYSRKRDGNGWLGLKFQHEPLRFAKSSLDPLPPARQGERPATGGLGDLGSQSPVRDALFSPRSSPRGGDSARPARRRPRGRQPHRVHRTGFSRTSTIDC